jgi:DNA polymerase III alpha subunit
MKYIDTANALRHAREVLGEENTDVENVAAALAGLPRSSEPDSGSIVYAFGKPIKEIIPLKRAAGKIMTQWDRTSCEKAGAIILPATHSPLFEKRKSFFKI